MSGPGPYPAQALVLNKVNYCHGLLANKLNGFVVEHKSEWQRMKKATRMIPRPAQINSGVSISI